MSFNLISLDKLPNVKNILGLELLKQNIKSKKNDEIKNYLSSIDKPQIYLELLPIAIFHQNFEIIKLMVEKFYIKNTVFVNMNASSFFNSILKDDSKDKITEGKDIYIDVQIPFVLMSGIGGDIEIFKYLLNQKLISDKNQSGIIGLSKKFKNIFNSNIIGACAYYGNNKLLEYLLKNYKNDLDVNVVTTERKSRNTKPNILKEFQGCTPCLLAVEGPSSDATTLETLKILSNHKANFGVNDFNEDNILHLATKAKKIKTAKFIIDTLKLKDLISEVNKDKYTPLSLAQHLNNDAFITYYSDLNEIDEKEIQDNVNELIESSKTATIRQSKKSKKKNKKKGKNRDMPALLNYSSENKESTEEEKNKKKEDSNNNKNENESQKEINSKKNEESQNNKNDLNEKDDKKEEEIKDKFEGKSKEETKNEENKIETKKDENKEESKIEETKNEIKKEKKEKKKTNNKKSKKNENIQTIDQQEDEFIIGLNIKKNKKNKKLKKENNDSPSKEKENDENKKEEKTNDNNKSDKLKNKSKKEKRIDKDEEEIRKKEEEKRKKEQEETERENERKEEEKRKKEEEEKRKKEEEEKKRKEEEEKKRKEEEEKKRKEEEEKKRKEEEEKKRKEEEEKKRKEDEKRRKEEEKRKKEEEEKRKKEEEEKKRIEEEEKRKKEDEEERDKISVSVDDNIDNFSSEKYEDIIQVNEEDYEKLNQKYIELGKKIENSEKEKEYLNSILIKMIVENKKNQEKPNKDQNINDLIYLSNKELEEKNRIINDLEEKISMIDLTDINNLPKEKLEKYKEFYTKNLKLINELMK